MTKIIRLRYFNQTKLKSKVLGYLISQYIAIRYACYFGTNAVIHPTTRFPHPVGIVIGGGVVIERDCMIWQNVTLGGGGSRRKIEYNISQGIPTARTYPVIKEGSHIYAGAIVIGKITVGPFADIGVNSVVNKDVPANAIVAGVPFRILGTNIDYCNVR